MGIPIVNFKCLVLCLNAYIPQIIPIPPKIIASINSVFSLIRHMDFCAIFLSYHIVKKEIKFITKKYIKNNFISIISPLIIISYKSLKSNPPQVFTCGGKYFNWVPFLQFQFLHFLFPFQWNTLLIFHLMEYRTSKEKARCIRHYKAFLLQETC